MSTWQKITSRMNPPVFFGSAALVVGFVAFGGVFNKQAGRIFDALQAFIVDTFGWFYIISASLLLGFVLWLMLSRFGSIRLGGDDARPEFPYLTWFAMLMSAGMGIGLVFFGVAEPVLHYMSPPMAEGETTAALRESMLFTFYHWGLHPWAIYSALALPLAYFHFRHKLPLAPRSLLYPVLGERIHGMLGHLVDIMCTVGTLFGVATSLGLGAIQINTGLNQIFGMPESTGMQILLIVSITAVATVSVVSGLKLGIRRLSEFNMGLAGLILLFFLVAGPTIFILELFISSIGVYLQRLPFTSFWIQPGVRSGWQDDWTLFYWSWWISWSPFVGVFVARISRGRTIREFIATTMLVPTGMGFLWFSAVGGTGLFMEIHGEQAGIAAAVGENASLGLYAVLRQMPLAGLMMVLATVLIIVFFVTSSDSGSLVDDMVTSGGHPNPPRAQRVFWAVAEGAVAATLLLAGGLMALRTASLTTGLPMALFLLIACAGLVKALRVDHALERMPSHDELAAGEALGQDRDPG